MSPGYNIQDKLTGENQFASQAEAIVDVGDKAKKEDPVRVVADDLEEPRRRCQNINSWFSVAYRRVDIRLS